MTLPRVTALMGAWAVVPPIHWSLSALAGFKPAKQTKAATAEQDLSGMFGIAIKGSDNGK